MRRFLFLLFVAAACLPAADISIQFRGAVNGEPFSCGQTYSGVGATRSEIIPEDFRFYVHDIRLIDAAGQEHLLELEQESKWQIERTVLIDFEDRSGGCTNGTPEINLEARGTVAANGPWRELRFTLGVPFNRNHTDLSRMPAPLNLTALSWAWNAGRKFARLEVAGFAIHLGSIGCIPNEAQTVAPKSCLFPNRVEVLLPGFDPARNAVIADLGRLLRDSLLERNSLEIGSGCMSSPEDADCAAVFANFGLPFGDSPAGEQQFFQIGLQ